MKSFILVSTLLLSLSSWSARAEGVLITVKGMVCAFCAQGIEKNFKAKPEVADTSVDLDKMQVKVSYKEGKSLNEEELKEIITEAGFSYVKAEKIQ